MAYTHRPPTTDQEAHERILELWPRLSEDLTAGFNRYRDIGQSVQEAMRSICQDVIAEYKRQNPPR